MWRTFFFSLYNTLKEIFGNLLFSDWPTRMLWKKISVEVTWFIFSMSEKRMITEGLLSNCLCKSLQNRSAFSNSLKWHWQLIQITAKLCSCWQILSYILLYLYLILFLDKTIQVRNRKEKSLCNLEFSEEILLCKLSA